MIDYTNLSKTISYILRHHPEEYNLELDNNGFVNIELLVNEINNKKKFSKHITIDDITHILNNSDKKRWEIKDKKIRAYYGHSIDKIIDHPISIPPEILYHGTSKENATLILKEGIKRMSRQYVHLSPDIRTAEIVGKRKDSNPIILVVYAKKAYEDGIKFYLENNIWLAENIPANYVTIYKKNKL